jgi:hypothetical protein
VAPLGAANHKFNVFKSIIACKDIGLTVNTRKTKYMEVVMANENIRIGRSSYEKVKNFKHLGSLLTNQNYIYEEIKCIPTARNSCNYSVQTFLSSRIFSKN